jgi:hypothetical protein
VSADARARRRRTLPPEQRALPIVELAERDAVYGYSFIVTNRDVSAPGKPLSWSTGTDTRPRSRPSSATPSSAPQCVIFPRGIPESIVRGCERALLAPGSRGRLFGHGVREDQAMIAALRHRLICVPARLIRHAGALDLRLPPGYPLLEKVLARLRARLATP